MIVKTSKNKKIQQKQNTCTIDLQALSKYIITTNRNIPASEFFPSGIHESDQEWQ